MIDERACEDYRKRENIYKELIKVNYLINITYSSVKDPWGKRR